jgi:hypothetical protein
MILVLGPHLAGSIVLAAWLVVVTVSRVAADHRVATPSGALYPAGTTSRMEVDGMALSTSGCELG